MVSLNIAVIIKLEPDFSEGNVSYNSDGTLNRAETKSILGPHSAVASMAALNAKVLYDADVSSEQWGQQLPNKLFSRPSYLVTRSEERRVGKEGEIWGVARP